MVGYNALNASTIFLQFRGMAVLMEGLARPGRVPDVVVHAPAMANIGTLGDDPMKDATGQVRVISMVQSSTDDLLPQPGMTTGGIHLAPTTHMTKRTAWSCGEFVTAGGGRGSL
jgi:hypothetical protein